MSRLRHPVRGDMYYHCVIRGNNRQVIFRSTGDMIALLECFTYVQERHPFQLLAFCFMTNHYHILIKTPDANLSYIMGQINRRYSDYYKRKYKYLGSIYEKRFWSKEVSTYLGLLEVSAYIHRNPIQTTVPLVSQLHDYPFSSFPFYFSVHHLKIPYLDTSLLPKFLGRPYTRDHHGYSKYVLSKTFHSEDNSTEADTSPLHFDWQFEGWRFTDLIGEMCGPHD